MHPEPEDRISRRDSREPEGSLIPPGWQRGEKVEMPRLLCRFRAGLLANFQTRISGQNFFQAFPTHVVHRPKKV